MNEANPAIRIALRWTLAAAAVVILLILAIVISNRTVFSASTQVKEFQQLLAEGHGGEALGLLNATVPEGDAVALDGQALAHTQQGITEFAVDPAQPHPDDADLVTVTARYKAHGVPKESSYTLRHAGKSWLFFDTWQFEPTELPTASIKANTVNEIELNGQMIPLEKGRAVLPVFFPAVLDAGFETRNFHADTRGMVVTSPSEQPVQIALRTEPTEHFRQAVTQQVTDYLDRCAGQKVLMPGSCPFAYHTAARVDPKSIDWKITDYPKPEISYYDGSWIVAPMVVSTQLHLTEQDLRTGAVQPKVIDSKFGFNARLETSTTKVNVRPMASAEGPAF